MRDWIDQVSAPDPAVKQETYGTKYVWTFKELPAQSEP
jgi:hypothetical protein